MDKLNVLTAGMPLQTGNKGYKRALEILNDMDLDGLELEFVRGVRIKDENRKWEQTHQAQGNTVQRSGICRS